MKLPILLSLKIGLFTFMKLNKSIKIIQIIWIPFKKDVYLRNK